MMPARRLSFVRVLARRYGVGRTTIERIRKGVTWKWLQ